MKTRAFVGLIIILTVASAIGCSSKVKSNLNAGLIPDAAVFGNALECLSPTVELPFKYAFEDDYLMIETNDTPLAVTIGPWGAHSPAHTNHREGNESSRWIGYFVTDYAKLIELIPTIADGVCQKEETCGIKSDLIKNRIPVYRAPRNYFNVTQVTLEKKGISSILGTGDKRWRVRANYCGYQYEFRNISQIAKPLRKAMIDAGYPDPNSDSPEIDIDKNLIIGDPITLSAQDEIGTPPVRGKEVAGFPGIYQGNGVVSATPWVEIEFTIQNESHFPESMFYYFDEEVQNSVDQIIISEAKKGDESFLYGSDKLQKWQWVSELTLATRRHSQSEINSIHAQLGTWWEAPTTVCEPWSEVSCDTVFSIYPIARTNPLFDPSLYYTGSEEYLAFYRHKNTSYYGEVIKPLIPSDLSGSIIFRWRPETDLAFFQAVSYRFFPEQRTLMVNWGEHFKEIDEVTTPEIPSDPTTCNGEAITCHTQNPF